MPLQSSGGSCLNSVQGEPSFLLPHSRLHKQKKKKTCSCVSSTPVKCKGGRSLGTPLDSRQSVMDNIETHSRKEPCSCSILR